MTSLLDANVLIALTVDDHVHHSAAQSWFSELDDDFATCPITQGSLLRLLLRNGQPVATALQLLGKLTSNSHHAFWPDRLGYDSVRMAGVVGHRQVTDAYLAGLARDRHGKLATFDGGLAELHSDIATLIEV